MEMELVTISPAEAQRMIEDSPNQFRRVDKARVARYAEDQSAGCWEVNGETIKLNCDGSIVDGMHRLAACVKSGVGLETWVCSGIVKTHSIDTGQPRRYPQILKSRGEINTASLASAVAMLWSYEHGKNLVNSRMNRQTVVGLDETLENNANIRWFVNRCLPCRSVISTGKLATVLWVGTDGDSNLPIVSFVVDGLAKGVGLEVSEPILHFREKLLNNKRRRIISDISETAKLALLIKAWNMTCVGKPVGTSLVWRGSGPNAEPFPEIIKWKDVNPE